MKLISLTACFAVAGLLSTAPVMANVHADVEVIDVHFRLIDLNLFDSFLPSYTVANPSISAYATVFSSANADSYVATRGRITKDLLPLSLVAVPYDIDARSEISRSGGALGSTIATTDMSAVGYTQSAISSQFELYVSPSTALVISGMITIAASSNVDEPDQRIDGGVQLLFSSLIAAGQVISFSKVVHGKGTDSSTMAFEYVFQNTYDVESRLTWMTNVSTNGLNLATVVPEPSTALLLALGGTLLFCVRKRRQSPHPLTVD